MSYICRTENILVIFCQYNFLLVTFNVWQTKQNTHTHTQKNKKETNKPNSRTGGNSWPSLDGIFHLIVVLLGKVSYLDKITSYLFNILAPLKPGFVEFLSLKLQRHSEPHHYKYLVDSMVQFLYSFQCLEPFSCQGFLS